MKLQSSIEESELTGKARVSLSVSALQSSIEESEQGGGVTDVVSLAVTIVHRGI